MYILVFHSQILGASFAKKASLEADTIEISAGQALTLKGQSTKLEGNMVEMKSQGSFKPLFKK